MKSEKAFILLVIVILLGVGVYLKSQQAVNAFQTEEPQGGDFVLQTSSGSFDLQDYRGKLVLIYFGYTYCPDICPTNLSHMAMALNELTTAELEQIQPVFISVDPARDSFEHLQQYAAYFHPDIIGMTSDEKTIAKLAENYGAAYKKVEGESEGGYLIDHSSFTYLVDQQGLLKVSFPHATHPQKMVDTIRSYLVNKQE